MAGRLRAVARHTLRVELYFVKIRGMIRAGYYIQRTTDDEQPTIELHSMEVLFDVIRVPQGLRNNI